MARRKWDYNTIQKALDGENVSIQSGYTKKYKHRKIGDEWTDGKGNRWRKTDGGKVRVNQQMDSIRELVKSRCSVCKMDIGLFGDRVDEKIFAKTGKCFGCLDTEEQILKITGKYEAYEQKKLLKNRLSLLREFRKNVIESIEYLKRDDAKIQMVCSGGEIVTWSGGLEVGPILRDAEADLILADEEIKKLESEVLKLDDTIN